MRKKVKKAVILLSVASLMTGLFTACSGTSPDTKSSVPSDTQESSVVSADSSSNTDESSSDDTESSAESQDDSEEEKKVDTSLVKAKANEYMTAIKNGDIDTLKELSDTDFYEKVAQPDEVKKILAAFYGNMIWTMDYLTDEEIQSEYESADSGKKPYTISFHVGCRRFMYFSEYDLLRYNKGDVIPDGFKYESDEDAWKAFNATLEKMPLLYQQWNLKVTGPDENGKITFKPYVCDFESFLDEEYTLSKAKKGTTLIDLLREIGNNYCTISPDGVDVDHNDEAGGGVGLRKQIIDLMKENKYMEAYELIMSKEDRVSAQVKNVYDSLTDSQKAYLKSILDDCKINALETQTGTSSTKSVTLLVDCPVLKSNTNSEIMNWITENKLRDVDMEYCTLYVPLERFYDHCFSFFRQAVYEASLAD